MGTLAETGKKDWQEAESRRKGGSQQGSEEHATFLQKFFSDQLKDMYYAEQELLKAFNEIKSAATTEELEDTIDVHAQQTKRHVKRLEKIFNMIGLRPEGKRCEAMDGLIKECKNIIRETEDNTMTRDAALIIAVQKIEHYEIASYGGLVALALTMGLSRAADILDKTLAEEMDTDEVFTDIAENYINVEAEHEGSYSWGK